MIYYRLSSATWYLLMPYSSYENPFDYDEDLADLYEKERKKSEEKSLMSGALRAGGYGLAGSTNNALAAAGRAVGLDSFAKNREEAADRWAARTAGAGYKTPEFGEIDSIGDALGWAGGALASNAPLLATLAATAPLGAAAGAATLGRAGLVRAIGAAAAKDAGKLAVARGAALSPEALSNIAKAATAGAKGRTHLANSISQAVGSRVGAAKAGGFVGSFAPYMAATTGENYNTLRNDPDAEGTAQEQALGAIGTGAAQAALGTLFSPGAVMNKAAQVARGTVGPGLTNTPLGLLATSTIGEGATEATEQLMQQAMHNQYNENTGYDGGALLESAIAGGVVGGAFAAPTSALAALRRSESAQSDQTASSEGTPLPSESHDDAWYAERIAALDALPDEQRTVDTARLRQRLLGNRVSQLIKDVEDSEDNARTILDPYRALRAALDGPVPVNQDGVLSRDWLEEMGRLEAAREEYEKAFPTVLTAERIASGQYPEVQFGQASSTKGVDMYTFGPDNPLLTPRAFAPSMEEQFAPEQFQDRISQQLAATRKALQEDAAAGGILAEKLAEQEQRLKSALYDHQVVNGIVSPDADGDTLQERFDALDALMSTGAAGEGDKKAHALLGAELNRRLNGPSPNETGDDGYGPMDYDDLDAGDPDMIDPYSAGHLAEYEGVATRDGEAPFAPTRAAGDRRKRSVKPFDDASRTMLPFDSTERIADYIEFEPAPGQDVGITDISLSPQYREQISEQLAADGQPYYSYLRGEGTPFREEITMPGTLQGLLLGEMTVNGKPMRVPRSVAAAVVDAMNSGQRVPMSKLFKMAQDNAEYATADKDELFVAPGYNKEGNLSMVPETRTVKKRPNPLVESYGMRTAHLDVPPIFASWATREANEAMAREGYVFVGSMDSKAFYATPEERKRFLLESGLDASLPADFNILARIGVLTKKESGREVPLDLSGIKGRHQLERKDPATGKKVVENSLDGHVGVVKGAEISQGVLRRKVVDPSSPLGWRYEYDKGILRSPLQARDFNYETGELGAVTAEEGESLNASLQLGRSRAEDGSDSVFDKESVWFKMKPAAEERGGTANAQALGFGMAPEDAAAYMDWDTQTNYEGKDEDSLLGPGTLARMKLGVPPDVNADELLAKQTKYMAQTARSYVMGSAAMVSQPYDGRYINEKKLEEVAKEFQQYHREYKPGGRSDVKLLPATYAQMNQEWNKKHGRNLQPGDVLLLHRDPALSDASSMSPFMFTGVSTLENDYGSYGRGIVVHPEAEGWADAAGDFDGDSGVITVPDERWKLLAKKQVSGNLSYINKGAKQDAKAVLHPLAVIVNPNAPVYEQMVKLPVTKFNKKTKQHEVQYLPDGKPKYWKPTDLIGAVATARATGFSGVTGQTVSQAQKLAEMGALEALIQTESGEFPAWELGAVLTQGTISAQKHPNWGERGLRALKALREFAAEKAPKWYDPTTFEEIPTDPEQGEKGPDYYVSLVNNIKRAPVAGSSSARIAEQLERDYAEKEGIEYAPFDVLPDGTTVGVPITKGDYVKVANLQASKELQVRRNWLTLNAGKLIESGKAEKGDIAALHTAGKSIFNRVNADPELKQKWEVFKAEQAALAVDKAPKSGMTTLLRFLWKNPEIQLTIEEDQLLGKTIAARDFPGKKEALPIFSAIHMAMARRMREQARLYEAADVFGGAEYHPETIIAAQSLAERNTTETIHNYLAGVKAKYQNLSERISLLHPLHNKDEIAALAEERSELKKEVELHYKLGKLTGPQLVAWAPLGISKTVVSNEDFAEIKAATSAVQKAEEYAYAVDGSGKKLHPSQVVPGVYQMVGGQFKLVEAKDGVPRDVTLRLQQFTNRVVNDAVNPLTRVLALDTLTKGEGARVVVDTTDVAAEGRNRKVAFYPITRKDEILGADRPSPLQFTQTIRLAGGRQNDAAEFQDPNLKPGDVVELKSRGHFYQQDGKTIVQWAALKEGSPPLYQTIKAGGRAFVVQVLPPATYGNRLAPVMKVLAVGPESKLGELKQLAAVEAHKAKRATAPQTAATAPAEVTPEALEAKFANTITAATTANNVDLATELTSLKEDLNDPSTTPKARAVIAAHLDKLARVYEARKLNPAASPAEIAASLGYDATLDLSNQGEVIKRVRARLAALRAPEAQETPEAQVADKADQNYAADLLSAYNQIAPNIGREKANSFAEIAKFKEYVDKLQTGTPEEVRKVKDYLRANGLDEAALLKLSASATAVKNKPLPNVAAGAAPPVPPGVPPTGPADPLDPMDPDGNRLPYEGATHSAAIPELRALREGFAVSQMQDTTESIGHLMGLTGSPNVVHAERMYDILMDKGFTDAANQIAEYARTGKGYRGAHFYNEEDGTHYIYVAGGANMTPEQQAATMSHETGHWLLKTEWDTLVRSNNELSRQVLKDFDKWAKAKKVDISDPTAARNAQQEWMADNIGRWISQDKKGYISDATGGTDSWFKQMADKFAKAFQSVKDIFSRVVAPGGKGFYRVPGSVNEWLDGIAKSNETVFRAYGGKQPGVSLASAVKARQLKLKAWAETGRPEFETINDLVPHVAKHLERYLGREDANLLRRTANAPVMRDRMFQLLGTNTQAADLATMDSDTAAAMMYVLSSNGIMKAPEGRVYGIVQKMHRLLIQANRMATEATEPEVDDMIKGLNGYNTRLPGVKRIIPEDSPAARFYKQGKERYARGVLGAAERGSDLYNAAVGKFVNVPYQRVLQTQIPAAIDAARAIQPMPWELGGMKRAGMVELQKVKWNEFSARAAAILAPLSDTDKVDLNNLLVPLQKITDLDNEAGSPAAKAAYGQIKALMNAMHYYETEDQGVKALLNVGERQDYWSMIPNHDYIRANLDEVSTNLTSTPYLKENWERVRKDYIEWVVSNKDPGLDAPSEAARDYLVDRRIQEIENMPLERFVATYFKEDDESMLPGWRFRQLEHGKTTTPGFRFANPRELDFLLHTGDAKLHDYVRTLLETDPTKILSRYMKNASKRVEFARMQSKLEGMNLQEVWAKIRDQAPDQATANRAINEVIGLIDGVNGMLGIKERDVIDGWITSGEEAHGGKTIFSGLKSGGAGIVNPKINEARSGIHSYLNMSHLTLNAATSIMDPLGTLMQTGNGKMFAQSLRDSFAQVAKIQKASGMTPEEFNKLAELIVESGVTQASFTNDDLNATYSGPDQSKLAHNANELFFKLNGVSFLSELSSRTGAGAAIRMDFKRMYDAAMANGEDAIKGRRELAAYGLGVEDMKFNEHGHLDLLKWDDKQLLIHRIQELEATGADPMEVDSLKAELEADTRRRAAILRYVEQSNVRPGAAIRPLVMSNPYYSLLSVWRGFMVGYDNQMMRPMMAKALQDGNGSPLLWTVATLVPVLMFGEMLRDAAKMAFSDDEEQDGSKKWTPGYKDSWTFADHVGHAFSKAGFIGRNEIITEVAKPLVEGQPVEALAQAGGVLTSDINKYSKWGSVPYPGRDLVNNWG